MNGYSTTPSVQGVLSVYDSSLFSGMFGTDTMRSLFTDRAYIERCVEAELALAKAESALGIIPTTAGDDIARSCKAENLDWDKLRRDTEIVGYPILPLVRQLDQMSTSGGWLHFGATTQDIQDTAAVLQMKAGLDVISCQLQTLRDRLASKASIYRDCPMAGRTHLQHALPVTFGYKLAVYLSALDRHAERLSIIQYRNLQVQFGGAAGTLASLGSSRIGLNVRAAVAKILDLQDPIISWHVTRDCVAEIVSFLSLLGASLGKMALDIMIMCSNEFNEIAEPFVPHRGASSTMPQKRNPISCEAVLACAKLLRGHASTAQDAMLADFERATGPWHLEWACVPESFVACSSALHQMSFVISGMEVNAKKMGENLAMSKGLIVGEAVMMGLAPSLGRNAAHDVVYAACSRSHDNGGTSLFDEMKDVPEVKESIGVERLRQLCDPSNYLGACGHMIDDVVGSRGRNKLSNGYHMGSI